MLFFIFFFIGVSIDFTTVTETYWMRDVGYSVRAITVLSYVLTLPFVLFRFVFGYYVDKCAPGLECFYIALLYMGAGLVWFLLGDSSTRPIKGMCFLLAAKIAPAIALTIADKLMVILARKQQAETSLPPLCHIFRTLGRCLSAYLGSAMMMYDTYAVIFYVQSFMCFAFAACVVTFIVFPPVEQDEHEEEEEEEELEDAKTSNHSCCMPLRILLGPASSEAEERHQHFVLYLFCLSLIPTSMQAIDLYLSGPLRYPATLFGSLDAVEMVSVFSSYIVLTSVSLEMVSYLYAVFATLINIPLLWILARQQWMMDEWILFWMTVISSIVNSVLTSRFSVENTKIVPIGKEAFYYSLYASIPAFGSFGSMCISTIWTEYFEINHDNFEYIVQFHAVCSILQALILFIPPVMILSHIEQRVNVS